MPEDQWHLSVTNVRRTLGDEIRLYTTEEVLTEFLTALSRAGTGYRSRAVRMTRTIIATENVVVIPQSHESFMEGLDLYERRSDKGYSLTDCISMNACRAEGIREVLTNDHHFTQEGFTVLITQ
jgi:predicted nucleic acid-binding protein